MHNASSQHRVFPIKPVTAAKNPTPQDIAYAVSHDLRAPLINIRGFSDELARSVAKLVELTTEYAASMPIEYSNRLRAITEEDFGPCTDFLTSSVSQLENQVEHITRRFALDARDPLTKDYAAIDSKRRPE